MNIEDHILALLAKELAHEASEKELHALDELLQQHPDIHEKVKLMTEWWLSDIEKSIETNNPSRFQKIMDRIKAGDTFLEDSEA